VVSLYSMLWVMAIFFGVIGVIRGLRREIVSFGGIVLATFALFQFDVLLRGVFLASIPRDQAFFVQAGLFCVVVYFAYQSRSFSGPYETGSGVPRGNRFQDAILGGLMGALNGYLIWGAIWYFLDINDYPFSPLITAPAANSISAQALNAIPLVLIGNATGGGGSQVLTVIVVILFVIVLVVM
jgi:hypothetical protein